MFGRLSFEINTTSAKQPWENPRGPLVLACRGACAVLPLISFRGIHIMGLKSLAKLVHIAKGFLKERIV
jgi:hypothetical protein